VLQDPYALRRLQEQALGHPLKGFLPWLYPPHALLVVYPLSLLPLTASLMVALGLGFAGYHVALRTIVRHPLAAAGAAALPAVAVNIGYGNTGFLTTALFAGALGLLSRSPVSAGVLLGILSFKAQLGVLVPFALMAGRRWRALAAAAATATGMLLIATAAFGLQTWTGFWSGLVVGKTALEQGHVPFYKLQSFFAAARLLGASADVGYIVHLCVAAAVAAVVIWIWRLECEFEIKASALVSGTLLSTPYLFDFDLVLMAIPLAFLVRLGLRSGWRPWEKSALAAIAVTPGFSRVLGERLDILISPVATAGMLAVAALRAAAFHAGRPVGTSECGSVSRADLQE
jgi:hypothetical protein